MKSETERRKTCRSVALYSVLSLIGKLTVYALFLKEVVERQSVLKSVHFYGKKRSTIRHTSEFKPLSSSIKV